MIRRVMTGMIRLYQKHISPSIPRHCRFYPTCSHYAVQAIRWHGPIKGLGLAVWRLLRCNPFNPGGYDPVPPKKEDRHSNAIALDK